MVKWNEPYQKLASCDSTGIIFVWIKYLMIQIYKIMRIQKYEIIRMKNSNTKRLHSAFMAQMESSDDL